MKMFLTILINFFTNLIILTSSQPQVKSEYSENELLSLVVKIVKDQPCDIRVVSKDFEKDEVSLKIIEKMENLMIPIRISDNLQGEYVGSNCQLNVVMAGSGQFRDQLMSMESRNQDFVFLVKNEEQAEQIFKSSAKDLKNMIVFVMGANKKLKIFQSGIFESKLMTQTSLAIGNQAKLNLRKLFRSKFTNMNGYTFRVAALPYAPYLMKNKENVFSGYEILQLRAIGSFLNFTYMTIEPPDGQWGKVNENGTWTGLIGHSLYQQTNWSMGMLSLTEDRENVIDFSTPFYFDGLGFVAPLPQELPKYLAIIKPFVGQVWIFVIIFVIFSGPVYWLLLTSSDKKSGRESKEKIGETFLYCVSLILKNTTKDRLVLPKQERSTKIFLISWFVFCLVVSTAYTGNLISFMTYPGRESSINSAEDILNSGHVIEHFDYGGVDYIAFEATENPYYQQIWKNRIPVFSFKPSMERVIEGGSVFIDFFSSMVPNVKAKYTSGRGEAKAHVGKTPFFGLMNAWACQPGAIFKEVLDETLLLLLSFGFPQKWEEMAIQELKESSKSKPEKTQYEPNTRKLNLENMQVSFQSNKNKLTSLFSGGFHALDSWHDCCNVGLLSGDLFLKEHEEDTDYTCCKTKRKCEICKPQDYALNTWKQINIGKMSSPYSTTTT